MKPWTYRCWNDGKSPSLWQRWYERDAGAAQGRHDAVFDRLEQRDVTQWREPDVKMLKSGKGLLEVRLNGAVAWRVFGFVDSATVNQFVVVHVGYHKGKVYNPKNVIKTAIRRKSEVEDDTGKAISCERPE